MSGMNSGRALVLCLMVAGTLMSPAIAVAQSSGIAGVVTDTTSAVVPGVSVEVRSPALIEGVRNTVTDEQGRYRIIDLRPGEYSVTFTLPGFSTIVRDGITLQSDFTAPVNVQMRPGALEETVTVTGVSPVVDIQATQQREVVGQELIRSLPTGRSLITLTQLVPSMSVAAGGNVPIYDVGGSNGGTASSAGAAYGGVGDDSSVEMDGMRANTITGSGGSQIGQQYNAGAVEEFVVTLNAGTAENQSGGVKVNMIGRQGSNRFAGDGIFAVTGPSLQSSNITDTLRAAGMTASPKVDKAFDVNISLGGPIRRDRMWFFGSTRVWTFNKEVLDTFHDGKIKPMGTPVINESLMSAHTLHLTLQATSKHRILLSYERTYKTNPLVSATVRPEAAQIQFTPISYVSYAKWTAPLTSQVLLEAGYGIDMHAANRKYEDVVQRPSAANPFGDISKLDLITNIRSNAAIGEEYNPKPSHYSTAALTYVTGPHTAKAGIQFRKGWSLDVLSSNGSVVQNYRNGVPISATTFTQPSVAKSEMNADLGLFVQDSWKINRLTLNPGIRYDYYRASIPEQSAPEGRWVPARQFAAINDLPRFHDVSPRFGAAFDLFGTGRTALKGSVGRYAANLGIGYPERYNPMLNDSDTRVWNDLNSNDIAEPQELGPPTNLRLGVARNRRPDPDLKRQYNVMYNLAVEHELRANLGLSVSYNRRSFHRMQWTDNLATSLSDYTLLTTPDPRGNGEMLPVYNLNASKVGLIDEIDTVSDANSQVYNGFDISLRGRLPGGAVFTGGTSTGRVLSNTCEGDNPNGALLNATIVNSLRFCDTSQYDVPFETTFKLSGSYPLPVPGGFRAGVVFKSVAGRELAITHLVSRTQLPTLTVSSVSVRLNEPGSEYYPRVNQLDFSLSGLIPIGGNRRIKPQIELFNALNAGPVLTQTTVYGPALRRPTAILEARLIRLGLQFDF